MLKTSCIVFRFFFAVLTPNAGIICHSNSAVVIKGNCSNLSSTSSTVLIVAVILRCRIGIVAINVKRSIWILKKVIQWNPKNFVYIDMWSIHSFEPNPDDWFEFRHLEWIQRHLYQYNPSARRDQYSCQDHP